MSGDSVYIYGARVKMNGASSSARKITVDGNGHPLKVGFTKKGNRHLYSDLGRRTRILRDSDMPRLDKILSGADFVRKAGLYKPRPKDNIKRFYYYRANVRGKYIFLHVAETQKKSGGILKLKRFLYAVTDNLK